MQHLTWQPRTPLERAGLKIVRLLHQENFAAFWVGGVVRNFLLHKNSDNLDIATSALPDQVEQILSRAGIKTKPVGKKFGSILALPQSQKIEITTFRSEGRYSDNRHPDRVVFVDTYTEDAKRRDFTVNALYFDPVEQILLDPTGGLKHLSAGILKFVGDPKKRIDEDALRMMRGVRLSTQLGFKLERNAFAAIKTRAKYIQNISGERVRTELDKILLSENRVPGLKLLDETGLLKFIIPEMEKLKKVRYDSKLQHLEGDMFTHSLAAVEFLRQPADLRLVYAVLFHDIGKIVKPITIVDPETGEKRLSYRGHIQKSGEIFLNFAKRFKFSRADSRIIFSLIIRHDDRSLKFANRPKTDQIRYLLGPNMDMLLEVWRADSLANLRRINGRLVNRVSPQYLAAKKLAAEIKSSQKLIDKLARGDLIMKFSKLQPGRGLGQKIEEVALAIVLGLIKSEFDLKKFLRNT